MRIKYISFNYTKIEVLNKYICLHLVRLSNGKAKLLSSKQLVKLGLAKYMN